MHVLEGDWERRHIGVASMRNLNFVGAAGQDEDAVDGQLCSVDNEAIGSRV